jgi:hypothetical protein
MKVMAGTITSSPGPIPSASSTATAPLVHELVSFAVGTPNRAARVASTPLPTAPLVRNGEPSTAATELAISGSS